MAVLGIAFATTFAVAQNYKSATIDALGRVSDKSGRTIGSVNIKGEIKDTTGNKIAYINSKGNLIDFKSGQKMGKVMKNGDFVTSFKETPDNGLTITAPLNGICLVKDVTGNVVAEVHQIYKEVGTSAIYCLLNYITTADISDEMDESTSSLYSCPKDKDMVSDKKSKCGKCGTDMTKK